MKFGDVIFISLKNLWKSKIRTFLTMFAVVIGALLISIVFTIVNGIEKFFNLQLETFSDPTFIEVTSQKFDFGAILSSQGLGGDEPTEVKDNAPTTSFSMKPYTDEQVEKIRKTEGVDEFVEYVITEAKSIQLEGDDKKYQTALNPFPEFMQRKLTLVAGDYIKDDETGKVIIAKQYADIWGVSAQDLIGKKVLLEVEEQSSNFCPPGCQSGTASTKVPVTKKIELEIAGVSEKTIISTLVIISRDEAVEIEKFRRGTDQILTSSDSSRYIGYVKVGDPSKVKAVEKKIEDYGHNAGTYDEQKNQFGQIFDILKYFLSAFGIIAMAVASLGIINTLFMAIYERTREIGVMKAVGATNFNILSLFTIEASLIGFIGGTVGMLIGYGIANVANWVLHGGISAFDSIAILKSYETLSIASFSVDLLAAPILATLVALIAGLIPAWRASRLSPVDALKYE